MIFYLIYDIEINISILIIVSFAVLGLLLLHNVSHNYNYPFGTFENIITFKIAAGFKVGLTSHKHVTGDVCQTSPLACRNTSNYLLKYLQSMP